MRQADGVSVTSEGVVGPAEREMTGWLVRALAVLRAAQLAPWVFVVSAADRWGGGGHAGLLVGSYVVELFWSAGMFYLGFRRQRLTSKQVWTDVVLASVCLVAVGRLVPPGTASTWANWSLGPGVGVALVAIAVLGGRRGGLAAAALTACYTIGVWGDVARTGGLSVVAGNVVSVVGFCIAGWFVAKQLIHAARRADNASDEAGRARQLQASTQARFEERTRQYRLLHDTVLSTLNAIARGGLDHRGEQVRARCSADADFLRGLISVTDDDTDLAGLPIALAKVARRHAMSGLRVHHNNDAIPHELPSDVVAATADAVNEALNNVVKHASVSEAWVTAIGAHDGDGGFAVTVVDRGAGFDPSESHPGLGVEGSMRRRMAEVGGAAEISSMPGEGTRVELKWPR